MHFRQGEIKELNIFAPHKLKTYSMKNIKSTKEEKKTKNLFHDSSVNFVEMLYYQEDPFCFYIQH